MKFLECQKCGKIVAMVNDMENCPTKCCNEAMNEIVPNSTNGSLEKHVPEFEIKDNVVHVQVGSVIHPSNAEHYIMWIALETNLGNQRKILKPFDEPKAKFALLENEKVIHVYAYCNLHGLYVK